MHLNFLKFIYNNFTIFVLSTSTTRSTHYDLILNESNFQLNQIETFTYQLCYLYGKSLKSTSIPIPVKYSHLACYRARSHLSSYLNEQINRNSKMETDLLEIVRAHV